MEASLVDLAAYTPVNDLWCRMVERLGMEKSRRAISQALDLHSMHGDSSTLPVLFFETCGLALVNIELIRQFSGIPCIGERMVVLASVRENALQVLRQV